MKKVWCVYTYAGEENQDLMLNRIFKYKKDAKEYIFQELLCRGLNEDEIELSKWGIEESWEKIPIDNLDGYVNQFDLDDQESRDEFIEKTKNIVKGL